MSDASIAARIERLVTEEQDLRRREQTESPHADALGPDRERLRAVEVDLDRCWDLLRQRRAREEFGSTPTTPRLAVPTPSSTTTSDLERPRRPAESVALARERSRQAILDAVTLPDDLG